MISPDHPTKLGSHCSNLPAVGREVLDCEGFFIAQKVRRVGHTQNSELLAPN